MTMIFIMCKGRNGVMRETNMWTVNTLVDVINELKNGGLEHKSGIVFPVHTRPKELMAEPSSTLPTQLD